MRAPADLLATIVASTRRIIEVRGSRESLAAVEKRALARPLCGRRLEAALARPGAINVIAECKRRSPSRGVLLRDYDPVRIARMYEAGGAAAISCLTEPTFFDGSLEHLSGIRTAVRLPILRKDFIVADYQLFEARAAGADAVLLIVAALEGKELKRLAARAAELQLDTLVEVHDERELQTAVDAGARIVGVNNRNLRTLEVDMDASERLIASVPRDVIAVSESGLKSGADLARFNRLGYRGFLIGERLMTDSDPGAALARLLAESAAC